MCVCVQVVDVSALRDSAANLAQDLGCSRAANTLQTVSKDFVKYWLKKHQDPTFHTGNGNTSLCCVVLCCVVLCCVVLCCVVLCCTLHNTTQHNTTQHNTTQHNTTQHNTTQHNNTTYNTTQHNSLSLFSLSLSLSLFLSLSLSLSHTHTHTTHTHTHTRTHTHTHIHTHTGTHGGARNQKFDSATQAVVELHVWALVRRILFAAWRIMCLPSHPSA